MDKVITAEIIKLLNKHYYNIKNNSLKIFCTLIFIKSNILIFKYLIIPVNNLNNNHLPEAQKVKISAALADLETELASLTANLTPQERQMYGSVNEQNKLLINKVWDFRVNSATLSQPDLDWVEFENDLKSRQFIEGILNRVSSIAERLKNAKTLHDYDNYQAALDDYSYTAYKSGSNASGYETKHAELKQFFSRTRTTTKTPNAPAETD